MRDKLIEFMDSLRDYVSESGTNIAHDERDSSEFVDIFLSQGQNLPTSNVMVSACKGGYLLKNNDCKKYGGVCVKHNCDYWQAEP